MPKDIPHSLYLPSLSTTLLYSSLFTIPGRVYCQGIYILFKLRVISILILMYIFVYYCIFSVIYSFILYHFFVFVFACTLVYLSLLHCLSSNLFRKLYIVFSISISMLFLFVLSHSLTIFVSFLI